jgi:UDP-N-acetyl-D-mannosaminuronic acid dehydrogenase
LTRANKRGSFRVTDDFSVLREMDTILIDVQTPTDGRNHTPSYASLREVSAKIGQYMREGTLVVTESTVAPGTTQNVTLPILEHESGMVAGRDFSLAFSYERVMPGKLIKYIVHMPRVVGGIDKRSSRRAKEMYEQIVKERVMTTDVLTAEFSKTLENSLRDADIALANEAALACEILGINVWEVRDLVNSREDRHMLRPGAVGGHCLVKDGRLLKYGARKWYKIKNAIPMMMLGRQINEAIPIHIAELTAHALRKAGVRLRDSRVCIFGAAYLENSDDERNTPTIPLYLELVRRGCSVVVHDPYISKLGDIHIEQNLHEAVNGSDAIVLATAHNQYCRLDLQELRQHANGRAAAIVDMRNAIKRRAAEKAGFSYYLLGSGKR